MGIPKLAQLGQSVVLTDLMMVLMRPHCVARNIVTVSCRHPVVQNRYSAQLRSLEIASFLSCETVVYLYIDTGMQFTIPA